MTPARTVIFDCDSTLSAIEGIDELAVGHKAEVSRLTALAMAGTIPLEQAYAQRLELIRPSRADLDRVGRLYIEHLVPDAGHVIGTLRAAGVVVRVLSGGLAPAVRIVAAHLDIPPADVAAVEVYFTELGAYAGFDASSPLARSGGKREWIVAHASALPRPVMLVGDGVTDLEARPVIDRFVAFAGIIARPEVIRLADTIVTERSLAPVLALALGSG
ncbi:MAG: HAD-IB family phosphatase [Gemmatimonadales bacterium]